MKSSKTTLSIDSSVFRGSVSLWKDSVPAASFVGDSESTFSKDILPVVHGLLSGAGVALSELEQIVYIYGPGSYTGLRVGISSIQGMCRARRDIELFPVSVFEAFSTLKTTDRCLTAMLHAKQIVAHRSFSYETSRNGLRTELSTLDDFRSHLRSSSAELIFDERLSAALQGSPFVTNSKPKVVSASDNVSILAYQYFLRNQTSIPAGMRLPLYLRE